MAERNDATIWISTNTNKCLSFQNLHKSQSKVDSTFGLFMIEIQSGITEPKFFIVQLHIAEIGPQALFQEGN